MNNFLYQSLFICGLLTQSCRCPEVAVPEELPIWRVPVDSEDLKNMIIQLRKCKDSNGNAFFPIVQSIDGGETLPGTDTYGMKHLETLFTIDGYDPKKDLRSMFPGLRQGLFKKTFKELKDSWGIDQIKFQYLPSASQKETSSCWLYAFINLARFFNPSLPLLNQSQIYELTRFICKSIPEKAEDWDIRAQETQLQIEENFAQLFNQTGHLATAPAFVSFFNLYQTDPEISGYEQLSQEVKLYTDALKIALGQCVQIPETRERRLFNPEGPSVLFMRDYKLPNPETKTLERVTPVLTIDPIQALSKESLTAFLAGAKPLIIVFGIKEILLYNSLQFKYQVIKGTHAFTAKLQIIANQEQRVLKLELLDSSTSEPLKAPSLVPRICIVLSEFARQAGKNGKNLMTEQALQEHSSELSALPFAQEKLKTEYVKTSAKFFDHCNKVFDSKYKDLFNGVPWEGEELRSRYQQFLQYSKELWEAFPDDGKRYLYAKKYLKSSHFASRVPMIDPQVIINLFLLGVGLSKSDSDFIEYVCQWSENFKDQCSLQAEFCIKTALFTIDQTPGISHTIGSRDFEGIKHLPECKYCQDAHNLDIKNKILNVDTQKFKSWFSRDKVTAPSRVDTKQQEVAVLQTGKGPIIDWSLKPKVPSSSPKSPRRRSRSIPSKFAPMPSDVLEKWAHRRAMPKTARVKQPNPANQLAVELLE